MSQSLILNSEQQQVSLLQNDPKDELDWLSDEILAGDPGDSNITEGNLSLDEELRLDDPLLEAVFDGDFDELKNPKSENERTHPDSITNHVENKAEDDQALTLVEEVKINKKQSEFALETGDFPEFDEENREVFNVEDEKITSSFKDKINTVEAEVVTIDDEDDIQYVGDEENLDPAGDNASYEEDYEEESNSSSQHEASVPPTHRSPHCILEYAGTKRRMSIRPEVRLGDFMVTLKNDLAPDQHIKEAVLTFKDSKEEDFLLVISQENYLSQHYTLNSVLELHHNFQRLREVPYTDLNIQLSLRDGFISHLQRIRYIINEATRANSAGNELQNPIVLDDSSPSTPASESEDENQNEETGEKGVILINSPDAHETLQAENDDLDKGKLVTLPPKKGKLAISKNELLNLDDDELAPYSDVEKEEIDQTHPLNPDLEKEEMEQAHLLNQDFDKNTLDLRDDNLESRFVSSKSPSNQALHQRFEPNNHVFGETQVEGMGFEDALDNNKTNDKEKKTVEKNHGQNIKHHSPSALEETFDTFDESNSNPIMTGDTTGDPNNLPDFEEYEEQEGPNNTDSLVDNDWNIDPLLDNLDSADAGIGKRGWEEYTNDNEVDDYIAKKARVA
ncbi:hypothetical protein G9A89_008164 [Geosiphon pyriformis]|nr:hypothetical protein G9A89_008164 [Geosiphon pyriformis]